MPELPEVETIVRQLQRRIRGKVFSNFWTDNPKMIATPALPKFKRLLSGKKILKIYRRGKIIILKLSGNFILAIHLRLTGQLFIRKPADPPDRFNHARLGLGKVLELRFNDLRKFGQIWLLSATEATRDFDQIQKLGPEPLDPQFSLQKFQNLFGDKKTKIKVLLMDQGKISGIGNIYSDEALFGAGIHPLTPTNKITPARAQKLYLAIRKVLKEAIKHQGTSDQWYRETHGQKGQHQNYLKVYHRTGKPCPKCGTKIERLKIGGRSAHFCPKCQK